MDFDFDDDQKALRAAVRDTLASEVDRAQLEDAGAVDALWSTITALGWHGLLVPEEHGGLGLGLVDAVVVQEEMGRIPLPGPFFSSAILATLAAQRFGADDLLAGLASGNARGTVALDETGALDPFDAIETRATRSGEGWVVDGVKPLVPDAPGADWVIVAARVEGELGAFLVESPDAERVPTLDPTRTYGRLELRGAPARRIGNGDDTSSAWRRIADDAAVALCAELTGVCEGALAAATDYAGIRVQFGRPIGSFQAIKHMAAEMLMETEQCRVAAHYAAWASVNDAPEREYAVAMAKSWCAQAAIEVSGASIQIHGGVGFTWECPAHLYFKRAKANDLVFGQQGWQRQRVADLVLG